MSEHRIPTSLVQLFSVAHPGLKTTYIQFTDELIKLGFTFDVDSNSIHLGYGELPIANISLVFATESMIVFRPTLLKTTATSNLHFYKVWFSVLSNLRYYLGFQPDMDNLTQFYIETNLPELVSALALFLDACLTPAITFDLKVDTIEFTNYRCFQNETFTFNPQSTVLIGKNASGKTSLLEGIAVAIGSFLRGIDEKIGKIVSIDERDVRFTSHEVEGTKVTKHHPPTTVKVQGYVLNHSMNWSRTRDTYASTSKNSRAQFKESTSLTTIVQQVVADSRQEQETRELTFPVFAYHGTGRVANFNRDMGELERTENISRFFAYKDCLKPNSDYKTFIAWYRKMKFRAFEMGVQIPSLDAVTETLIQGLQLITEQDDQTVETIKFDEGELFIKYSDGRFYPISSLSDGYKDVIGIISDIAFRMAVLNPHLGRDITSKTPGIILIDEIDLHLHPKWQQNILRVLKTLFPRVQFISTTHSPIIVSTTEENEALELYQKEDRILAKPIGNPSDWYITDILTQAFHLSRKPARSNSEPNATAPLEDRLRHFSDLVKDYVSRPDESKKQTIEINYQSLLPSLPVDSPKRRAVDSLKGLVK